MSAKFLHVFTDEHQELQKQIGCMAGIFQIFDRQLILTGRQLTSHHRKRLSSGHAMSTSTTFGAEQGADSPQIVLEGNRSKSLNEKRRISIESSRTSFSSSSSSTSSSLECNKTAQQESPSLVRSTTLDKNLKSSPILRTPYAADGRPSDFRDFVKDSINRDTRSLLAKTSSEEDVKKHVPKHRDSPWTMQLSKSVDRSYMTGINGKSTEAVELNFPEVIEKLKEAPWNFPEAEADSLYPVPREACRFLFDGRESSHQSLDSQENSQPSSNLQDLPRLSLDSKEGSLMNSSFDAKPNTIWKDIDRIDTYQRASKASNLEKELDSDKRCTSVVAKLMGLEAMPSLILATQESIDSSKAFDPASTQRPNSSKASQRNNRLSHSQNSSFKNPDLIIKPIATPKVPIETAPWKKQDRIRIPRKTANAQREANPRQQPESVYGEIEKRLKELELRQSNKDLRALKQILEAMQAKGLLDAKKGDQSQSGDYPNSRLPSTQNSKIMDSRSPRALECPIVIMRPGNSVNKSDISPSSGLSPHRKLSNGETMARRKASTNNTMAKDCIPKSSAGEISDKKLTGRIEDNVSCKARSTIAPESSRPKQSARENSGNPVKTLPALNPRLRQKKPEMERRSRSPLPSSDSSRPQRTSANRQQVGSVSPRSKLRRKPVEDNYKQLSECSETRNSCYQGDETSQRSDGSVSLASQVDIEVTSANRSAEMNSSRSPSGKAARKATSVLKQKKPSIGLREHVRITERSSTASEHPSPISVLDAPFNQNDLPTSPLKTCPDVVKGETPNSTSKIDHKKLQSIENLVQKLSELTSSDDKPPATDHIALLCETHNPDHHYVSEILLASGLLLKDLSSGPMGAAAAPIQLHPSGHPINPDLFLVLEQTSTRPKAGHEKLHRKLVFDVVNEVLIHKMERASAAPYVEQLVRSRKLAGSFPSGQRLLKELCLEIDRCGAENLGAESRYNDISISDDEVLQRSDFCREVAGAVLEIERSILKDLIDEVVSGEKMPVVNRKHA